LRYGIDNTVPIEYTNNLIRLARWLQKLRDRLSVKYGEEMPISITSGYRCSQLNKKIRGSKTSAHRFALAADFKVIGLSVAQTQADIIELMQDCLYDQCIDEFSGWLHIGLAIDGDLPRMENLIARKRVIALGRVITEYTEH
jgi:hypothetical protein